MTVYIVLGVLYESYVHPITILSTLPSAGVGAIAALILFKEDLDVIALIGIILLIGIVKKNAIMMIDFALEAERHGREISGGGHISGLSAAVPAHHDDDDGGAARRGPAGVRYGRGFGVAQASGYYDYWRTDCEPGADVVYDAGYLSGVWQAGDLAGKFEEAS